VPIGARYKVYLETGDGKVMECHAIASTISVQNLGGGAMWDTDRARTTITLEVLGAPTWILRDQWEEKIEEEKQASEWKCDYCGRPNQREDEACKSCNGLRSFIYT
jgi:hypothetical protein